jgi:hypothetical protein
MSKCRTKNSLSSTRSCSGLDPKIQKMRKKETENQAPSECMWERGRVFVQEISVLILFVKFFLDLGYSYKECGSITVPSI